MDIDYSKAGTGPRSYYLRDAELTNESNLITMWLAEDGTYNNVIIAIRDEVLQPIRNGFVKALRYYPGYNSYELVEVAKTDTLGNANLKLVERDVDYRFIIEDSDGGQIYQTQPMRVVCTSTPCILEITAGRIQTLLEEVIEFESISANFNYNNATKYLTFTYSDTTGLTSSMRLQVVRSRAYGEQTVCDTTIEGSAGIIPCFVEDETGDYIARVYRSASPEKPFKTFTWSLSSDWQNFGAEGLIWMGLFVLTMFLAGTIISPIVAGILSIGAIVFMMFTGIVFMPYYLAVSIVIAIIIYIVKMRG
jgi:hypothetical protein